MHWENGCGPDLKRLVRALSAKGFKLPAPSCGVICLWLGPFATLQTSLTAGKKKKNIQATSASAVLYLLSGPSPFCLA